MRERLRNHYENDVWEKREKPPSEEEWNKPLPEYMRERQEKSYLALWKKTQEEKDENVIKEMKALTMQANLINKAPSCTIL